MGEGFILFKPLLAFVFLIIMHLLLILFLKESNKELILNTSRYVLYLLFIAFYLKFFNVKLGYKIFKFFTIFASLFVYIQVITMKFFNYYLFGYIPFLPLVIKDHVQTLSNRFYVLENLNRPYSIFEEPSHFALYVTLFIALALFSNIKKEKNITIVFIIVAVFLSVSYTGILLILILLILKLVLHFKKYNNIAKINLKVLLVGTLSLALTLIVIFYYTNIFSRFNYALNNRIKPSFSNFFSIFSSKIDYIIGIGMSDLDLYYPAITRTFIYFGLIGFLVLYSYILYHITVKKKYNKVLLLLLLLTTLGTEILYGKFMILYLPFIILTGTYGNYFRKRGEQDEMRNGDIKL